MLNINMSDVVAVLKSLIPELVVIGVFLVLAIIISIAVNKRTVKSVAARKMIHSQSWLVTFVAVVVALATMMLGPLSNLITKSTTKHEVQPATAAAARTLAKDTARESVTLLENRGGILPLKSGKVNVFGWASTNPVYGGTGSGSMSKDNPTESLMDGLHDAGLKTNGQLTRFYTDYRKDRPVVGMFDQDWTLPEPAADKYTDKVMDQARSYSDTAVVVIGRVGGEGADLPKNMKAKGITYHDNDKAGDFKDGQSFLELSKPETDMVANVTKTFNKVVLVYNGANTFDLNFVGQYPQIQSVVWCPPPGQAGFTALGEVLKGEANPSGRTSDTFVRDLTKTPSYNNFGDFMYKNMDEHKAKVTGFTGKTTVNTPSFVNYAESIYVGYRFYETASDEGAINYDDVVRYPFGYGLSYTTFSQKMSEPNHANGKVSFDVTVTNSGAKAGKDTVEVYYNPPYTNGGVEKASANLIAFDKTKQLKPGESQTVHVSFKDEDMASYDYRNAKAYVLEQGRYGISIRSDSHHVIDSRDVNVDRTVTYDKSHPRSNDKTAATNRFDDLHGKATYLSRADHFANYGAATAAPTDFTMSDEAKAKFTNNANYDPKKHDKASDTMPATGAKNGIRLHQLRDKKYDDPQWDKLLDQLTVKEMDNLIAMGGYSNQAIKSIGKIELADADGPAALNNNFTKVGSIGFPSSTSMACTWNKDLASRYGRMIGDIAHDMNISGWYAPAFNIHRNAFAGRTFEYFSEDPLVNGTMGANEIAGAKSKGVYSFMKHFALNEQETNRLNMLSTWADEQTLREIYLKPFQMAVEQGGAQAAMSALNYAGPTYVADYAPLMQDVLRGEWGFRGMVVTDYFGVYGYQNADQLIRNGNDMMLATTDVTNHVKDDSATSVKAMREASHNILYTAVHSYKYENGDPKVATPAWQMALYAALAVLALVFLALEYLAFKRFKARRKAIDPSVLDEVANADPFVADQEEPAPRNE
ncbi:glycoside hydrolase family 3 N-terminal domain-containing protein [Bifidobacterium xylocopae]|uniref:Beta-glucosidase n=1 Tax=Bifidobacterium xylocopae TaxID=2493119 RepID=A0A366KEJ0_9BIFI|nr:glycoside hydrolase family 3 N-terminal domain-containing protein [Bifidobacterium xylocopae]RBP99652.1 beta-glucosidase [Bifidobacterium xylocopae]